MYLEMGLLMLFYYSLWGTKLPRDVGVGYYFGVQTTNTTVCMLYSMTQLLTQCRTFYQGFL